MLDTCSCKFACRYPGSVLCEHDKGRRLEHEYDTAPLLNRRSTDMELKIKRVGDGLDLPLPKYHTDGAAGMDLRAAIRRDHLLMPGDITAFPCGVAIEIPPGFEGQVRARAGLAFNYSVTTLNGVGTIDSDYRGEVGVVLHNHGIRTLKIEPGQRIAQLVISPVQRVVIVEADELSETERGDDGRGSTGSS